MLCFFLTSGLFFSKCTYLWLRHFTSPSTCPINSIFSEAVRIYKIHVFDETFSLLLRNHCYDDWKSVFFLFLWQPSLGKFIYDNHAACQPSVPRILKKICCKEVSFSPLLRTQTLKMGSKCSKNTFFYFLPFSNKPNPLRYV